MHSNFCLFFPLGDAKQCFKSNELTSISFVFRWTQSMWTFRGGRLTSNSLFSLWSTDQAIQYLLAPLVQSTSFIAAHCRDLEVVSSLARVRNSGSSFQSNVCNLLLPGLAAVCIIGVSVIAGCPQGESWLYNFSSAFFDGFFWLFLFTCACSLLV